MSSKNRGFMHEICEEARRATEVGGRVCIVDLEGRFVVTDVSIREDRKPLETKGMLNQLPGGAVASRSGTHPPIQPSNTDIVFS